MNGLLHRWAALLSRHTQHAVRRLGRELGYRTATALPTPWLERFDDPPWDSSTTVPGPHPACNAIFREDEDGDFFAGDFFVPSPTRPGTMQTVVAARLASPPAGENLADSLLGPREGMHLRVRGPCVYVYFDAAQVHRPCAMDYAEKFQLVQALRRLSCGDLAGARRACAGVKRSKVAWGWKDTPRRRLTS
jgi:hypothetical protein